ncbi:MAG: fimbrillin family protein [Bacteroidaceae bacterium]|nr:fimbrillin family protein [Bacteroidaceae bacterium]
MKKSFLIAAMAGLAFVGCTESELDSSVKSQEAISFNAPAVRPNTRAAEEVGNRYATGLQFNVWGTWFNGDEYSTFSQGKMYINEATAQYGVGGGNTWYPLNGGNYYYWPKNGSITFSAYSPASNKMKDAAELTAKGVILNGYVVDNTDNSAMEDVLFSERAYNKKASTGSNSPYSGVDIQFRHALSSILFSAKVGDTYPGTQVRITSITLSNVASKAYFSQNLDDANEKTTLLPTSAGTSASAAAWTGQTAKVAYTVDNAEKILENGAEPWYFCTTDGKKPQVYGAVGNEYRKSDLLLIPQNLDGVELTINYTIKSADSEELAQEHVVTFDSTSEWKIGYRYIYNIAIDFDPITLAPMVSLFVDATGTDIAI